MTLGNSRRRRREFILVADSLDWLSGMAILSFSVMSAFAADRPLSVPPKNAVPVALTVFNFDRDPPGKPPEGFTMAVTGVGPNVQWEVQNRPDARSMPNVLAQIGKVEPGENYALALLNGVQLQHGEVAVRFKIIKDDDEQAVGLVWRYKDPQNYYVVRASAKEEDCAVYRVKNGRIKRLTTQAVIVSPYTWHDLRLVFVNNNYSALFDEELILGSKDSGFLGSGLIGLWTKSAVRFDDLRVSK